MTCKEGSIGMTTGNLNQAKGEAKTIRQKRTVECQSQPAKGNVVIDAILEEKSGLYKVIEGHDNGYSVHTDDWVNYTDHANWKDK